MELIPNVNSNISEWTTLQSIDTMSGQMSSWPVCSIEFDSFTCSIHYRSTTGGKRKFDIFDISYRFIVFKKFLMIRILLYQLLMLCEVLFIAHLMFGFIETEFYLFISQFFV